jgi:outer membrane protein TolC
MTTRRLARALSLGLLLLPAEARAEGPLGLEEAVRLALSGNERALKAPLRVEVAEGQLDKARAAFLPTLSANGVGSLHPLDKNSRLFSGNSTVQLSQPVLALPAFPLYASARRQVEAERWGAAQDKRLVAFDTARAFVVVLNTQRLLDAARKRLERARAVEQNADARARAQLAGTNDVTLARVDTATAARDVATAEGNLARAYVQLSFLVGRPVAGALADPERTMRAAETGAFRAEDVLKLAEARRPDVRSAEEKTASLREAAREPLYRLLPTLALTGQVKLTADAVAPDKTADESAQLTLTWNLYDAGVRYADRRVRVAQAESQALDERALRRSIAADVGLALASLKAARETYRISGDALEAARQNAAETSSLYNQGLIRALELVTAESRRYDAEVSRETARLSVQQAYLDLRLALGLDPTEDDAAPAGSAPAGSAPGASPPAASPPAASPAPRPRPPAPAPAPGVQP